MTDTTLSVVVSLPGGLPPIRQMLPSIQDCVMEFVLGLRQCCVYIQFYYNSVSLVFTTALYRFSLERSREPIKLTCLSNRRFGLSYSYNRGLPLIAV